MSWKHSFNTKTFSEFMHKFFENSELQDEFCCHFFNKKVVCNLEDNRTAEIEMKDYGCVDNYTGFKVDIISKQTGVIASEWFGFKDYLEKPQDENDKSNLHVWKSSDDIDWYCNGAVPSSIPKMIRKMVEYISIYNKH